MSHGCLIMCTSVRYCRALFCDWLARSDNLSEFLIFSSSLAESIFGMSSDAESDPREQIFPNWFDLSIKIHGYETKGKFGTVHVLNSNKGQKTTALKLFKPLSEPKVSDEFVCESIDQSNEEFELVKGIRLVQSECTIIHLSVVPKEKKEEKKDDGQPRRMKNFKYTDPISDFGKGAEQLQRRLMVLKSIKVYLILGILEQWCTVHSRLG